MAKRARGARHERELEVEGRNHFETEDKGIRLYHELRKYVNEGVGV